jgi:predicted  nucleic acid-binding Zn-ribbon protein
MPYCPVCGYEYIDGVEKCPDCGVDLVDQMPTEPAVDEEMVPIYYSSDDSEVMILKGILEDAGIPVWQEADIMTELNPLGETREPIAVPASRVEEAKKVIKKALEEGKTLPSDS